MERYLWAQLRTSAESSKGPFLCSFMHSLHRHFNYEKKAKQGNKVPMR